MRGSTINSNVLTSCIGLQQAITTNRDEYRPNSYTGKNFYEDDNYRSCLDLLDGGYEISQDLIEMMDSYCEIYRQFSRSLMSFSENWCKRIQRQNTLCSYHTTKQAQLETIKTAKKIAVIEQKRIGNIQKVVEKYRKIVDNTYITTRFSSHQHRRTKEFKKQFKAAYSILNDCKSKLDNLKQEQKKAQDELKQANSAYEIVFSDSTMTPKQRARATETQSKRQGTVTKINEQISLIQNEYNIAKKTYQKKAKSIYLECQVEEQQRLDLIKETLIDFCHAIQFQIDEQSDLDNIYSALVEHIETRQNTSEDITYWVQSYGIADQTTDSICEDLEQTSILSKSSKVKKQLVEESTANTASLAATVMNTSTVSKNAEKNQYESSVTGQTIVSKKAQKKEQEAILEDEEEDEGAKTKVKRTKSINSKKIHLEADEISTTTANVLASV